MAILSGTTARSFSPNPDDSGSGGGRRSRPDIGLPWASADQSVLGAALELQPRHAEVRVPIALHNGSLTPTAARRLLYAIVGACVALTGAVALLRPAPPPAVAPQHAVTIAPRLPFAGPDESLPQGVVVVPLTGLGAESVRMGVIELPVHGLPGQIGAAP